jgi:KUP system potassium uptake protein
MTTSAESIEGEHAVPQSVDGRRHAGFWGLTLGAIGVVYGDIGTSPLYAFKESVIAAVGRGNPASHEVVLGILSLVIWALLLVVTLKYIVILLRTDNHGEGGTLALMALANKAMRGRASLIMLLGIISGGLFFGDAIITPALSVLSAVEGIKIITPAFEPYVIPITAVILLGLFSVQSRGTARVAALFGPITLVWFVALGLAGLWHISDNPSVLLAFDPRHGVRFLLEHGIIGFMTLGAVFLVVTGAEALYADLGHFGRGPIRSGWLFVALPALTINYLGQGALVLATSGAIDNPFFLLYPQWALIPMVVLATAATVIASQAVITGAYSITQQAIQLGVLPRLEIRHTSEALVGQIYMPRVNAFLLVGVLALVFTFGSSNALASAYGIAVTGTMVVTAILAFVVIWKVWNWSPVAAGALVAPFLLLDLAFLGANLLKVMDGGWVPLILGGGVVTAMYTWRRGSAVLAAKLAKLQIPLATLMESLERSAPHRVPGTAVFLTGSPDHAPTALLHNLKHNKVLHERNVVLTVEYAEVPHVPPDARVQIEPMGDSFLRMKLLYGFMDVPNIPQALTTVRKAGWHVEIMATSFYVSRRSLKIAARSELPHWQDRLFISLASGASDATNYFRIPTGRVVEIGAQVAI